MADQLAGLEVDHGDLVLVLDVDEQLARPVDRRELQTAADGADLGTLTIGKGPDAVIYDPDRHLAFIPCGWDGVLEVVAVNGASDVKVIQSVPTQPGARTGAVDEKTGRLYLPTAQYTLQPGQRPVPTPGTFEILVVSPN